MKGFFRNSFDKEPVFFFVKLSINVKTEKTSSSLIINNLYCSLTRQLDIDNKKGSIN